MARVKKSNWQENYAGLILGAIIVVILGLLVANFITNRNDKINEGEQITNQEQTSSSEYTVEQGDSLSKIAEKLYGEKETWPVISRVNKIANPNIIHVGTILEIPSKDAADDIKEQMTQTKYEVQEGDTVFIVAEKMYGNGALWPTIASANRIGRLPNGNPLIFTGSTLVIPR